MNMIKRSNNEKVWTNKSQGHYEGCNWLCRSWVLLQVREFIRPICVSCKPFVSGPRERRKIRSDNGPELLVD
jgi:hypothetical protein